ncbi:MAG: hypothetical protein KGI66_04285 [Patescibacteria group bacterium]|nr:hypothetical protein [Patescibacteria group bacterium]
MNPNTKYKFATELPQNYSGTLHFTNFSDEPFQAKWNSIVYTFPPKSTIPISIPTASPIETFNIRTMWAKQLADREFRKSKRAGELNAKNQGAQSIMASISYTESELDSYIARCLEPLPIGELKTEKVPTEGEKRPKARTTKIVKNSQYGDNETDELVTGKGEAI